MEKIKIPLSLNILAIIPVFVIMIIALVLDHQAPCNRAKKYKAMYINGVVQKKYLDRKNHLYETIVFLNQKERKIELNLSIELSGFYDKVMLGDSLFKKENSLDLFVYRENELLLTTQFDYGCAKLP